ncbi:MinD/ParA family ATP-binding protein [Nocardioides sp.]|uniref:MinD/ParA family ATP-binding protein n=1 Tax=Nocardioides sp. TaxID=35761 RepID=UPI003D0FB262
MTTTALGLALLWPRPVLLIEADPTGGSGLLAGYFRGTREYDAGLIELALATGSIPDALADVAQPIEGSQVSFVAGTRSHTQAAALRDLWQPLSETLAELEATGQDVIVDAGRLGLTGSAEPLLAGADLTLLVTRATLPALAAARSWADSLQSGAFDWHQSGVLLVDEGTPYSQREVASVLDLPVIATIAEDAEAAAVFHRGAAPPRRFETGPLARSLHAAIAAIHSTIARRRTDLLEGAR